MTAFIYPTVGAWTWGGGWLAAMGCQDFAGSTIVHGTGGGAALAGARLKVDDAVGPVPAHLFARAWGTIATAIGAGADIGVQLLGVVSIGAFAFVSSWLTWLALEKTRMRP